AATPNLPGRPRFRYDGATTRSSPRMHWPATRSGGTVPAKSGWGGLAAARIRGTAPFAPETAGWWRGCASRSLRRFRLSYHRRLAKTLALFTAVLFGALALWACGPFFPDWLVTRESGILEAPTV